MSSYNIKPIHWLGHASFRLQVEGMVIYLDPWQLGEGNPPADLILITHEHHDHCSPQDVAKIQSDGTFIVTIKSCAQVLDGNIHIVKPGDQLNLKGVDIQAVPAYNVNKFRSPGVPFHPKEKKYVGFILALDGQRIYHAGDTDVIPEMETYNVDIALLPVSGTYVMTVDEALQAGEIIQPKVIVPMHIGRGIGAIKDAETFKERSAIPVEVLPFEG